MKTESENIYEWFDRYWAEKRKKILEAAGRAAVLDAELRTLRGDFDAEQEVADLHSITKNELHELRGK